MIGHAIPLGMGTATRAAPAFSESGTAAAAATALVDGLLGGILNLSGFCRRIDLGFEGNRMLLQQQHLQHDVGSGVAQHGCHPLLHSLALFLLFKKCQFFMQKPVSCKVCLFKALQNSKNKKLTNLWL